MMSDLPGVRQGANLESLHPRLLFFQTHTFSPLPFRYDCARKSLPSLRFAHVGLALLVHRAAGLLTPWTLNVFIKSRFLWLILFVTITHSRVRHITDIQQN